MSNVGTRDHRWIHLFALWSPPHGGGKILFIGFLVISLIAGGYFTTYLSLLDGQMYMSYAEGPETLYTKMPVYSSETSPIFVGWTQSLREFFKPANYVDRCLRPSFWAWNGEDIEGEDIEFDEAFVIDMPQ